MNIDFRSAKFLHSGVDKRSFLLDRLQVVFIGRSNAGKSSLINALCDNKKLMKVSKEAGRTRMMNYLDVASRFYIVDAPGYGYASRLDFTTLLSSYLMTSQKRIKMAYWLFDPLREIKSDDLQLMEMLNHFKIPFTILFAKSDKYNASDRFKAKLAEEGTFKDHDVIYVSAVSKAGLDELRGKMAKELTH